MVIRNCKNCEKKFNNPGNKVYCGDTCRNREWRKYIECPKCSKSMDQRRVICYECENGEPKKLDLKCPKCNRHRLVRKGFYKTRQGEKRQRYHCKTCKSLVTFPVISYCILTIENQHKIIEIINSQGLTINKFDNRQDTNYLSSRGLVREVKITLGIKISKGSAMNWIRKYRKPKNQLETQLSSIRNLLNRMPEESY